MIRNRQLRQMAYLTLKYYSMTNNLIDVSKNIVDNIENIDDLVDNYFDPITDLTETAGDIFTPIKAIHSLYTLNKKRKFKNFLKAYAEGLRDNNFNSSGNVEKLKKYLKNEKNFNFMNDVIENAINAKSIYASILLGYYAGRILSKNINIRFHEIIIIEGIKELNDIELSCFARIYNYANLSKEVNIEEYKDLTWLKFFCELTIDKLIQLRIVEEAPERYGVGKKGRFVSTEIAEEIHELIQSANILNELLNYKF